MTPVQAMGFATGTGFGIVLGNRDAVCLAPAGPDIIHMRALGGNIPATSVVDSTRERMLFRGPQIPVRRFQR
jgi:hypothetical protein